jgi:hypothetical protein
MLRALGEGKYLEVAPPEMSCLTFLSGLLHCEVYKGIKRFTLIFHHTINHRSQPISLNRKVQNQISQPTRNLNFQEYRQHSHGPLIMPTGLMSQYNSELHASFLTHLPAHQGF